MNWIKDRITPERIEIVDQLTQLANELNITTSQLAIAWLLRRKEVSSVITGATNIDQLQENIESSEAIDKLEEKILDRIDKILDNCPDEN